jgi:hypothetical protein
VERRRAQLEESVARYLSQLDTADRHEPTKALATKAVPANVQAPRLAGFSTNLLAGFDVNHNAGSDNRMSGDLRTKGRNISDGG